MLLKVLYFYTVYILVFCVKEPTQENKTNNKINLLVSGLCGMNESFFSLYSTRLSHLIR